MRVSPTLVLRLNVWYWRQAVATSKVFVNWINLKNGLGDERRSCRTQLKYNKNVFKWIKLRVLFEIDDF